MNESAKQDRIDAHRTAADRRAVLKAGALGASAFAAPVVRGAGTIPGFGGAASGGSGCSQVVGLWVENCTPRIVESTIASYSTELLLDGFSLSANSGVAVIDANAPATLPQLVRAPFELDFDIPGSYTWCSAPSAFTGTMSFDFSSYITAADTVLNGIVEDLVAGLTPLQVLTVTGTRFDVGLNYTGDGLSQELVSGSGSTDGTAAAFVIEPTVTPLMGTIERLGAPCLIEACPDQSCTDCTAMPRAFDPFTGEIGDREFLEGEISFSLDLLYREIFSSGTPTPITLTWTSPVDAEFLGIGTGLLSATFGGSFSCELP